ncbi:hypothetical protein [Edaphobacter aggregans]|uniref:hypothetical protein n=1 Tax=Edaphobacter aggregans TaxID=570835 RepID=UPI0005556954|nr:hypothetical protein [Edaphobacter aggregans]
MKSATRFFSFVSSVALLTALLTVNGFAKNKTCSDVGGAILTNVGGFGQIDGHPTTLGVVTGDLKGAIGVEILSTSSDSTTVTVEHHLVTDTGETLTIDQAQAHGTFVRAGLFTITDYKVHLTGGTGRFANATGDMTAIGEIDFNTGHAILRYSGQVCYASKD